MTDEMQRLLDAFNEYEESEAGQKKPYVKKNKRATKADSKKMTENASQTPKKPSTPEEFRKADMERTRREMYAPHETVMPIPKEVPIWAKYALTLPEAVSYFHIGYNKLREIVRKDKYAEYLLWNGGRVYIKRKLFEEFLNQETEI